MDFLDTMTPNLQKEKRANQRQPNMIYTLTIFVIINGEEENTVLLIVLYKSP